MIYVFAPSHGPTGRHRPEHESLDRGEDVFTIVKYDIMPVSKDNAHNHSSKWFTLDRMILYRKTDMGKSHPVIRASHMTPLTWQHLPVPVHLCMFACVRNVLLTTDSCDDECEWRIELERTCKHSQCLTPNPSTPPVWLWSDRVFMLAADVRQAHQIFRPRCKTLKKGSLLKGSCHFLRLHSLIQPGLMA